MDTMTITLAGMINKSRSGSEDAYYAANAPKRLRISPAISALAVVGLVVIVALGAWPV
jgi:hypothetical protein